MVIWRCRGARGASRRKSAGVPAARRAPVACRPSHAARRWHAVPVRAMDNQCYIAMANRAGPGDSYAFCGESQFADPFGQTLARIAGDAEGLLDVRLDPLAPGRARAQYRG